MKVLFACFFLYLLARGPSISSSYYGVQWISSDLFQGYNLASEIRSSSTNTETESREYGNSGVTAG